MDRNGILILVVAGLLFFLWPSMVDNLFPPPPAPPPSAGEGNATTAPEGNKTVGNQNKPVQNNSTAPAGNNASVPVGNATQPGGNQTIRPTPVFHGVQAADSNDTLVMESNDTDVHFIRQGGGISVFRLNGHIANITEEPSNATAERRVGLNLGAPDPVLQLRTAEKPVETQDGEKTFLLTGKEDYDITIDPETGARTATALLRNSGVTNGVVRVVKEFPVLSGYMMSNVVVRIHNDSPYPLRLPSMRVALGTATDTGIKTSDTLYNGVFLFNGQDAVHWEPGDFANRTMGCFPGTPIGAFTNTVKNTRWMASHNQFFTIMAIVQPGAEGEPTDRWVPDQVIAEWVDINDLNGTLRAQNRIGVSAVYGNHEIVIPPNGERVVARYHLYAGPRKYSTFEQLTIQHGNQLDAVMDLGGFFGFFSKVLLLSMNGLHGWGMSYAMAIIIITIIVKLIFWPLTAASTRSMKRMGKLQPQMKEIQDRYKDDPQKMNQKLMTFMRENKVNPMAGCLPILIQIPVFFGFFFMIRTAVELRGAPFLWAADLSSPDTIYTIPGITFLPLFSNAEGLPLNPLPILMGVTMIYQMRLTPQQPGADPMQAKMMKILPLIFIPILYNFSSGLTLYWTVQNILSIAQTLMTKDEPDTDAPAKSAPAETLKERKPRRKRR